MQDERDALERLIDALYERREARTYRRLWSVVMLTPDVYVAESICLRRPVPVRKLEPAVLKRAMRGGPLPPVDAWLDVTDDHLDAIAEGGAFDGDD